MELVTGLQASVVQVVTDVDTAISLGSGDVPVLATPRLLAWAEAATVAAVAEHLDAGTTSVGTRVELDHQAASRVGTEVTVNAELVGIDGRTLRFTTVARDSDGQLLASATVTRAVVDRERFLARL